MKIRLALVLVILAALTRLLPHPHNFTPLGAIGLFGAAYFQRRWLAVLVPLLALFLTDLVLNNIVYSAYFPGFTWFTSFYTYAAMALVVLVGWLILGSQVNAPRVVGASLSASVLFFLVSNFGTWAQTTLYPKTAAGLAACYTAGLPFFGNTVLGDFVFSAVLFGGYAWASRQNWALAKN